jgi:hypothetical protein
VDHSGQDLLEAELHAEAAGDDVQDAGTRRSTGRPRRAIAALKTWKILARLRCRPRRATTMVHAVVVRTTSKPTVTRDEKGLSCLEPRYQLLHVTAKITPTARVTTLRIAAKWPWTDQLFAAFQRLAALPEPVT